MGFGISVWQLIILVLLIGIPVGAFYLVRKGPRTDLVRPLRFLDWSFWAQVLTLLLAVVVALAFPPSENSAGAIAMGVLWLLVLIPAGWVYWVALGVLAKRLGRSPIIWIGLTFITSPFGVLVAYVLMRGHTLKAIAAGPSTPVPNASR